MSKEDFKSFVRNNPFLITKVKNNETTWQQLYEIYSLYGEDKTAWNNYLSTKKDNSEGSVKELVTFVKNIDLNKVRSGVESLSKAVGLLQGLGKDTPNIEDNSYYPRETYQHFDD